MTTQINFLDTSFSGIRESNGSKEWYLDGKLHRLDGPAIERANGGREWWVNGELYREDGPSIEWT